MKKISPAIKLVICMIGGGVLASFIWIGIIITIAYFKYGFGFGWPPEIFDQLIDIGSRIVCVLGAIGGGLLFLCSHKKNQTKRS